MRRISVVAASILFLALGAGMVSAQSGYDLFQQRLVKERANGDLPGAV
jgi:hypothetical protein